MAAQIRLRDAGGTLRTVTQIRMRDNTEALRTIRRIRMRDAGNVIRTVFDITAVVGGGNVNLSNYDVFATRHGGNKTGVVTSESVTSTVTFGTPPYTYHWTRVSGSTAIIASTPTAAATTFTGSVTNGINKTAQFKLTVTDSLAVSHDSDPVDIELEWNQT